MTVLLVWLLELVFFIGSASSREMLFITLYGNNTVMRCELDGSNPVALVSGLPEVNYPDGVQVDVKRGKMYWSNMGSPSAAIAHAGSIYTANLDGTGVTAIIPPGTIGAGKELHLDAERQHLYVGDKQNLTAGIWGVDLTSGPPFTAEPLLMKRQPSASGVTLDHTGEKLLITSDGGGHPNGIGVMGREIPKGMSAVNRTDVSWIYTTELPIDVIADSKGQVYWTDSGGISEFGVRVGSVDGKSPARTIQTKKALKTTFPVGITLTADEQTVYFATFGGFTKLDPSGHVSKSSVKGGPITMVYEPAPRGISVTGISIYDIPDQFL